tara:strand:+ start:3558 stop:5024 length:1467 start_codon:yes stop_codon:yes gene_type:complete
MKTFYNILHKQYTVTPELKNEFFKDTVHTIDINIQVNEMKHNKNAMNLILISGFIYYNFNIKSIKEKFNYIKKIIDNPFLSRSQIDNFIKVVGNAQMLYKRLCRLVHIWKWRRKKPIITTDLLLNPIKESDYFTIAIMHLESKYLFTKSDLTKIIEKSLTNSPDIFAEPVSIKNPYNNLTFDKHNLYNIYFFIKYGGFVMPTIFHQYFLYNFHLKYFRDNNESLIRKMHILTMINTNDTDKLLFDINTMLLFHNDRVTSTSDKINIHDNFPDKILINAMKPYLHIFYVMNYSLDIAEKGTATHELYYLLHKFKKQNPAFGRKLVRLTNIFGKRTKHIEYSTQYIPYNKIKYSKDYESCHEEIIENNSVDNENFNLVIPTYIGRTSQFNIHNERTMLNFVDSEFDCDDSDDSDDELPLLEPIRNSVNDNESADSDDESSGCDNESADSDDESFGSNNDSVTSDDINMVTEMLNMMSEDESVNSNSMMHE